MARVLDVATYVLDQMESISTMKLQKLVFYSQAYHLVQYGTPLFQEPIEAWANGPVVPALFRRHKGEFVIVKGFFDEDEALPLTDVERSTIDHVVACLRDWTGAKLSDLTHSESPWCEARGSLSPTARSNNRISQRSIARYYGTRPTDNPVFA